MVSAPLIGPLLDRYGGRPVIGRGGRCGRDLPCPHKPDRGAVAAVALLRRARSSRHQHDGAPGGRGVGPQVVHSQEGPGRGRDDHREQQRRHGLRAHHRVPHRGHGLAGHLGGPGRRCPGDAPDIPDLHAAATGGHWPAPRRRRAGRRRRQGPLPDPPGRRPGGGVDTQGGAAGPGRSGCWWGR